MSIIKEKGLSEQYTFRIPTELRAQLDKIAEEEDRSLSRQIISVLRRFVDDHEKTGNISN